MLTVPFMAPHLSSWAQANESGPRFCQKVYEGSNYFKASDLVDVCKTIYITISFGRFGMELI